MIAIAIWLIVLVVWAIPAFPNYDILFWVATFFIPPLIAFPIIEAAVR